MAAGREQKSFETGRKKRGGVANLKGWGGGEGTFSPVRSLACDPGGSRGG